MTGMSRTVLGLQAIANLNSVIYFFAATGNNFENVFAEFMRTSMGQPGDAGVPPPG
jgi:hypothetical protein